MREIKINVFKVDELSDKAKDRAYSDYMQGYQYPWHSENVASLNAFAEMFNIKVTNYSYGGQSPDITWQVDGNWDNNDDEQTVWEEFEGFKLARYVWNNYHDCIFKPKQFWKNCKCRKSRIFLEINDSMSGFWTDHVLLEPFVKFLNKPEPGITLEDLIQESLNQWLSAVNGDAEYMSSMEAFIETSKANEWEYYEDGRFH